MLENIRLSFQGIFSHKMRSFLTMLGIIIGIAAIIAIVSTIKGTNDQIKESLVGSGDNLVRVYMSQGSIEVGLDYGVDLSKLPIMDDSILEEIKDLDAVEDVTAYHKNQIWTEIKHGNTSVSGVTAYGADNHYIEMNGYTLVKGRLFTDDDIEKYKNVVILDSSMAYGLFEGSNPINGTIEISGVPFVVVGVVEKTDDFELNVSSIEEWETYYGSSAAGYMILPDTTWPVLFGYDQPSEVTVKADKTENMSAAGKNTQDYLNSLIDTGKNEDENTVKYKCEDTLEKAKKLQKLSNATSKQLLWIASISLLVGGIGVMNIMLVSVTERTREIGLKKALGARRGVILGQFLTEAAVLTSIGGVLGVGAGIGLAYFVSKLAEVPVAISVPAAAVSVVFSMAIGIIFGLIPSIKASKLDPIDALRYE